jgi:RecA-family ATPase
VNEHAAVTPRLANVRAEEAVIGKIIRDANAYQSIAGMLTAEHFTKQHHREIFTAVANACEEGKEPSISLLESRLPIEWQEVGSVEAVLQILIEKASDVSSATDFTEEIVAAWQEREKLSAPRRVLLKVLNPPQWQDAAVPDREWAVAGLIPQRNVTTLSADGGLGKTVLTLQLQVAAARSRPWLGAEVQPARSLGCYCEDDESELHRRMVDIAEHNECRLEDLHDVNLISRVGEDNILVEFDARTDVAKPTALYQAIGDHAVKFGARLVILDSLHDVFGGNEISRSHTRQFIGYLRRLALRIDGAVLLNAHPSVAGMNSGTGSSGSTGWNNAVRSRLYLTRSEDATAGENVRILTTKKSNYGPLGAPIELRWQRGVFVRDVPDIGDPYGSAEEVFLVCLDQITAQGKYASAAKQSMNFAPKIFAPMPAAVRTSERKLRTAMDALFHQQQIKIGVFTRPNRSRVECIERVRT